jgi:hypothetical protein
MDSPSGRNRLLSIVARLAEQIARQQFANGDDLDPRTARPTGTS